jgi:hypothetical protein
MVWSLQITLSVELFQLDKSNFVNSYQLSKLSSEELLIRINLPLTNVPLRSPSNFIVIYPSSKLLVALKVA